MHVSQPALPSPADITLLRDAPRVEQSHYVVQPRSVVVLGTTLERAS